MYIESRMLRATVWVPYHASTGFARLDPKDPIWVWPPEMDGVRKIRHFMTLDPPHMPHLEQTTGKLSNFRNQLEAEMPLPTDGQSK